MAYSPDSTKLAIAQSDNIVFVYKLGTEWGERKSICNKFLQQSPITCLVWPLDRPNEVVFGLAEGRVRIGNCRSNKAATLYSTESYVTSLSPSPDGSAIISGHNDGSIYCFCFQDGQYGPAGQNKLCTHPVPPYALAWGEAICAAGNDCKVSFYDKDGTHIQNFDHSGQPHSKEFTVAAFNPSGESVVLGSFNRFFIYNLNRGMWEEVGQKVIENFYSVTSLAWKQDGSRLAVGNLTGAIECYDACIRRYRYQGKFEFTYVSTSQVIVKRLATGQRIVLKSHFGYEVTRINIYQDRFLVAHTPETLLMGDLDTCNLSEIAWMGSGQEKFYFDNPQLCMIFNAGELSLVEYGRNEILGSCRTEHMNSHYISVRIINDPVKQPAEDGFVQPDEGNKKIAYLIDMQTVRILDLVTGITLATVNHDVNIDWLELNETSTFLLFRDKKRQLHLYNIEEQSRSTLLNYCSYVQWVPDSDVVVAQNRTNLCVWYSIEHPERTYIIQIKGDVEDIERNEQGRTVVVVDEGINSVSYALDQSLIDFGSAMKHHDYDRAMACLENLELTPETEAMWGTLANACVKDQPPNLMIAERCYAALGDISKTRYLHKVNTIAEYARGEIGGDGTQHFMVRAKMAVLQHDFKIAENILVDQGQIDECLDMYQELHKWDEAIFVAEAKNHENAADLRSNYYTWLIDTGQEGQAAVLKEREGDMQLAVQLYLKGGLAGRAAQLVQSGKVELPRELQEKIATALVRSGLYDKAGAFLEKLQEYERALDAYRKGHAYRHAVDLARREFPQQVVTLEEDWGDYLCQLKQVDMAVSHYIDAGQSTKAIEAAILARQWNKAIQILDVQDPEVAQKYYKQIARHYEAGKQFFEAEKYFIKAHAPQDAVDMYSKVMKWDDAHKVAVTYMSESDIAMLYITQAQRLEAQHRFKDAEKLYLLVKEPDLAINMYKKNRQYDQMVRLVTTYRKDLLTETHLHLAQQLEHEGNFREAESHYVEAKDWKPAVNMYRANDMWDDAIRVAKLHGGASASKQVAFAWAVSLGGEAGAKLLQKFGLIEQAIDYAIESNAFQHAFELARISAKDKLPEVHLKYAMYLEDEGRFKESEEEFIQAAKPKEAIDMYLHNQDWPAAMRIAENHSPDSIADIFVAQGKVAWERKEIARAEQLYLKAKKPELLVDLYKKARMWQDAMRLCKGYLPHRLSEVQMEAQRSMDGNTGGIDMDGGGMGGGMAGPPMGNAAVEQVMSNGRVWEENKNYSEAIDSYLKATTDTTQNLDMLEEAWEKATHLAMTYCPDRIPEVVRTVSERLISIQRFAQAAELYESIGQLKAATEIYVRAGDWGKARALAASVSPEFADHVEKQYIGRMQSEGRVDDLLQSGKGGSVEAGLDVLAQQGQWDRLYSTCQQQSHPKEVMYKYQAKHLEQLVASGAFEHALAMLEKYDAPLTDAHTPLYSKLCIQTLGGGSGRSMEMLAALMEKIVSKMRDIGDKRLKEYERLALITDLSQLKEKIKAKSQEHSCKIAISLLRYAGEVPADRVFYEAGMGCKEMEWNNMAFVFLNRYLDISEAIEDGEATSANLDNSDFKSTEIPYDFPLPRDQCLDDDAREEVRDWVLQLSMDGSVVQSLTQTETDFVRENLRLENTQDYWRVLESDYDVPAGPVAPMILKSG